MFSSHKDGITQYGRKFRMEYVQSKSHHGSTVTCRLDVLAGFQSISRIQKKSYPEKRSGDYDEKLRKLKNRYHKKKHI